ncbi:MAG: phage portal protein [Phycisphaerae bacterium]
MGFEIEVFNDQNLNSDFLDWLVEEKSPDIAGHFNKLWEYYTNRTVETSSIGASGRKVNESGRCYIQAQEYGLPARITGLNHCGGMFFGGEAVSDISRKEVVIENDIAWRINAAMDFLFGKMVRFVSLCSDEKKRAEIEAILNAVFSANGQIGFFQDMVVLASVYGFVDCIVRPDEIISARSIGQAHLNNHTPVPFEEVLDMAKAIDLELIEAPRALPVLEESDYRKIRYYVQHFVQKKNSVNRKNTFLSRLTGSHKRASDSRDTVAVTEIISPNHWQRYEDKQLVSEGELPWGFLPVVHIQNIAQPYYYEGISDVEPLIPLQDELNTRLSDRANRITFQSFKMYLGKGIEGFENRPISPGRMWCTDNPQASIEEFGGDSSNLSEDAHIAEIREAMDKASSVTPVVAGVLKNKLGNLTSAVALRLTMMGMLSKNERKRFTYGQGIKRISEMILSILDKARIYPTEASQREIEVVFPNPLPEDSMEKLKEAQIKKELGVPAGEVLKELGYHGVV